MKSRVSIISCCKWMFVVSLLVAGSTTIRQGIQQPEAPGAISPAPVMTMGHSLSAATFLRKVADWDGNSPNIDQMLTAAFEADDYLDCVKDLKAQNIDLLLYINSLDEVSSYSIQKQRAWIITTRCQIIDSLPVDSNLRRRCIRALRKTCGLHGVLPTSHIVSFPLHKLGKQHFTSGGSADVWKFAGGEKYDQVFAVKSFRMHEENSVEKIDKVQGFSTHRWSKG
jgi:hypothetical protein